MRFELWNWDQNGIWVINWGEKWDLLGFVEKKGICWDLGRGIGEKNGICWDLGHGIGEKWDLVGFGS